MKIGDKVIVLYNSRQWNENAITSILNNHNEEQGEITKIARKYITVKIGRREIKVTKPVGIDENAYYWQTNDGYYRMYESVDDIETQFEYENLRKWITSIDLRRMSHQNLKRIQNIIMEE